MNMLFPRGLIVSCQALAGNPLRDSDILAHMAKAAELGGARAIRANGVSDISAMRRLLDVPIIGINKMTDDTGRTVITPTFESARAVVEAGADIIALDATFQTSTLREDTKTLIGRIHAELGKPVMADISTADEAEHACAIGADLVSTTLAGYLPNHHFPEEERYVPDFPLIKEILSRRGVTCPVVGEGRFWRVEDMRRGLEMGLHAIVVGKAITNPMAITAYYTHGLQGLMEV
ncbi:MAG: N-acetylmannosamine-6-phosphate 2-epimerase [Clostridia bacterium]|nr:N-acetylmannosamine-6-phosphate 2-epimerase [Clostridia bacterium]